MIRQPPSAGLCKYLHNYDKKRLCKIFAKERKEKTQRAPLFFLADSVSQGKTL